MKSYTHVIWDFNGTVLDDMQAGIDSVNVMLAERGLPTVDSVARYRELFDFPVEDYYRRLGFDFEKEDYHTVLAPMWVRLYCKRSEDAPLFPGVKELTAALRRKGVRQTILSASETGMMREQLRARGALDWFDEIVGNDSIHAYGKIGLAAAWRQAHPEAVAVVLGDTTHDYEVAAAMGADCILVAAGHHSEARLRECGVPVVRDLSEAAALLGALYNKGS
jgi:phosphoglycolate phosphatase